MEKVVKKLHPESRGLFLIASSMGGAVAAEYLELHSSPPPFEAVVLSAPMFAINTKPYPEYIAHGIVTTLSTLGFGRHYAIGQHDCNPKQPFEGNRITGSRARWAAYTKVGRDHPEILIGGASNRWVETSLNETSRIRKEISKITTRVLILEAGDDDFVLNKPLSAAASQMRNGRLVAFPDSQHGILLESDPIRNKALGAIERFFERRKGAD
jgi:lysophospholipase